MSTQAHFVKRAKTPHGDANVAAFSDAEISYGDSYYWWTRGRAKFLSTTAPSRNVLNGGTDEEGP